MAQTLEHNKEVTTVVPVTIPAFDDDLNIIQKLDDEPNDVGGLTAAELKAKFDEGNLSAQQYINNVLIPTVIADDLSEQARQAAEAERVANEIERVTNEQNREKAEEKRVNETSGVVAQATAQAEAAAESARKATQAALGQIVDGSLEPAKFSGESRSMMVRENLLDNWYFGNPVNQRGQTEYTAFGYTIDRWVNASNVASTIDGSGITVVNSENWRAGLTQRIEADLTKELIGKTVTASALVRVNSGNMQIGCGKTHASSINVESPAFKNSDFSLVSWTFVVPSDATALVLFLVGAVGASFTVKAVKLELGSTQTLAHQNETGEWVLNEIPNYAEELAKCQRYYIKYGSLTAAIHVGYAQAVTASLASGMIHLPVSLRANPTIATENMPTIRLGITDIVVTKVSLHWVNNNILYFAIEAAGLTVGETYVLRLSNATLAFDANL